MDKPSEHIAAAAALSRIAEIRQFRLEEDYAHLAKIEIVQEINAAAKEATGIDLLNTKESISVEDIEKYEIYLDRIIDKNLSKKLSDAFLADEIQLLNSAKDYSLNSFRSFNIDINHIARVVKESFRAIRSTVPSILAIIKDPIRVQVLDTDGKNFLALSKMEVKSRPMLVLFHINIGQGARFDGMPVSLSSTFEQINTNRTPNSVGVMSCFFLKPESLISSPVHMFFRGIIKYGRNISIGQVTKKFFLKGYSSNLLIREGNEIVFDNGISGDRGKSGGTMQLTKTITGYEYDFLYLLSIHNMERDYNQNILL